MSTLKVDGIRSNSASSDAITLADNGTCTANITNKPNRNLIINGAMQVAQRGTSSTSDGYLIDRFNVYDGASLDEACTREQVDVASGTTPYTLGFRKALKLTNGNQTSGAQASDNVQIIHKLEAQDIANSGWNYLSASSYITLSFWVKSSVAQNFYVYLRTHDGTGQRYAFETGSLSADTWTKVTKTISGNSNLQFDNNVETGFEINISPYWGTNYTDSGVSLNAWAAYASGTRTPDFTTTWFTTNDATFEVTGLQLEVSDHSTDFEHRSYGQELQLCQRYYEENNCTWAGYTAAAQGNGSLNVTYMTPKRAAPTLSVKTAANSVQNLTSQNLQDGKIGSFVVDTRINSNGYGRFYDLLAASNAEL